MTQPDDELRARLARLDPAGAAPVGAASSRRAAEQMERAMQTLESLPATPPRRSASRRVAVAGGAALVAAAAVTTGVLVWGGDDAPPAAAPADEPTTLTLTAPMPDAAASCMVFDEQLLAAAPVAFAGTVVSVAPDEAVLDVDRWFTGGDADRVRVESDGGIGAEAAALGYGVDLREGERYVVSATDGQINGCGYSAPATPEMEATFERAFAG